MIKIQRIEVGDEIGTICCGAEDLGAGWGGQFNGGYLILDKQ